MNKTYYIYLLTNTHNTTLYTGVTSDLQKRIYEHKNKLLDGFTKKYNLNKLVYYEAYTHVLDAIA
jgi:putative endonuclease